MNKDIDLNTLAIRCVRDVQFHVKGTIGKACRDASILYQINKEQHAALLVKATVLYKAIKNGRVA